MYVYVRSLWYAFFVVMVLKIHQSYTAVIFKEGGDLQIKAS